ncbi:TPA: ferredoxin-type protein NapF [Pasteurella multocida]|uniref:ferredoxin-type protein NapF n=1 Tax=Pasteurella multocida TaxID=747 RepID=UPI0028E057C4|nr:ferredoxin-type protein NapF [Pasteurella multocida]MDY0499602.1 ferredoxin-type protein NapF [Pasteurella multocida]MDY0656647.1 ferredoxin-type protein NapF [Pasteurella multocida]WRU39932.1 ferredoxin-type protein NapF [Pasteurella multocida]HDR1921431.1 ferredoxin-type protein NapF [Pasteurella multocida]HEA3245188.1 ferredoxin-type protein NapF [Pasteurella multocida]
MTVENVSRRHFLRGQFLTSLQSEKVKIQGFQGIRPPWSVDEQRFIQDCDRCGDCIAVCETQILIKGEGGFPEVQLRHGECTFCHKCVDVCQQPVFRPLSELAWTHKVAINKQCLTSKAVECRSCEDSCEMRAIYFKRQLGGISQPLLALENCNGCGACLRSCPVSAITLSLGQQHQVEK